MSNSSTDIIFLISIMLSSKNLKKGNRLIFFPTLLAFLVGILGFLKVFSAHPRLHLFDKKYSKNCEILL